LVDVFRSKFVLSQDLIGGQVEDVEGVRASLDGGVADADSADVQDPESVAHVRVDPKEKERIRHASIVKYREE
jgi:hypothetical protein